MIRLCINTQTPPIHPNPRVHARPGAIWRLGRDYVPNVGGVVPMMRALLRASLGRWVARSPRWVALGAPGLPEEVRTDEGYLLETFELDPRAAAAYRRFKEAIWRSFHSPTVNEFPLAEYPAFVEYNYRAAARLVRRAEEYDLFYVHDFQQLLVGGMVGSAAPALLRWHIPVELGGYPEPVRRFLIKAMEGFDAVVVSTRTSLEELLHVGFHGRAFQIYPYLDPRTQTRPTAGAIAAFRERLDIPPEAPIVLSVGRMDPVKRQDLLLEAFATVRRRRPDARLVLAGGGSFSTRDLGAPDGASKATVWRTALERQVRELRLGDRVRFTDLISDAELQTAYGAASLFVHPAPWEGFGLVAVEAWLHGLPVIVSRGAGVAELVEDDVNGFAVPPGSAPALARRMLRLLDHPDAAERMGEVGRLTARRCDVARAAPRLREIFEHTIQLYEWRGVRAPTAGPDPFLDDRPGRRAGGAR